MKKFFLSFTFLLFCLIQLLAQDPNALYRNKTVPIDARVDNLLSLMTIEEKIMQVNQWTAGLNNNPNNIEESSKDIVPEIGSLILFGSNPAFRNYIQKKAIEKSRLGIPILFGYDVIHGFKTVYPIPLAQACSWNPAMVTQVCSLAAAEAKNAGINWTFAPMIDVARDPRWGRVSEGYGEDPYATSVFCVSSVKGYQGPQLNDRTAFAACLKHYVGYGMSEGGRDYRYSDVSAQSLWETYLPPYEAGIKAGAATVMSSFNDISGTPSTVSTYLLTDILKKQWGHKGFVVSDWESIAQLVNQRVAADRKESAEKAFAAGVDMDMVDNVYKDHLKQLIDEKKISMDRLNDAVRRILRLKFQLGLFENPYVQEVEESKRFLQPDGKALAEKMAEESMVLLKNKDVLPLKATVKRVAVIGPMAQNRKEILGNWAAAGDPKDAQTIYEGLEKEFAGKITFEYAPGSDFDGNDTTKFAAAYNIAKNADLILVCLGEKGNWSGENGSRSTIALPAVQEKLVQRLKLANKPLVITLTNGRPLELVRLEPLADAIIEMWQPGIVGGSPLAGILSGRINPSGKLAITFPLTTGQIPTYYNMRHPARYSPQGDYQDIPTEPLYWFGHGLSYSKFNYGTLTMPVTKLSRTQKVKATIEVTNGSAVAGKETILWYISDPASTISRPIKELKFFEKREIKAGEKTVFTFELDPVRDLSYVDSTGKKFLENGTYFVIVNDQKFKFELTD